MKMVGKLLPIGNECMVYSHLPIENEKIGQNPYVFQSFLVLVEISRKLKLKHFGHFHK